MAGQTNLKSPVVWGAHASACRHRLLCRPLHQLGLVQETSQGIHVDAEELGGESASQMIAATACLRPLFLVCWLARFSTVMAQDLGVILPAVEPLWDKSLEVHAGVGYTDNVLLASVAKQSSSFTVLGADAALFRVAATGPEFSLFLSGEDRRFSRSVGVDHDESWIAIGKLRQEFPGQTEAALSLQYLYQDQVFDISATETNLLSIQLRGHGLKGTPSVGFAFWEKYRIRLEWPISRQYLAKPLDDYWETGLRLTLEWNYGHRSSLSASSTYFGRQYDTRPQSARDGSPIAGTELHLQRHDLEVAQRHYWDAARRWRSDTKLGVEINRDPGSGYFSYDRFRISEQIRYAEGKWSLQAGARLSFYGYSIQRADPPEASQRHLLTLSITVRGEVRIRSKVKGFLDIVTDQNYSNRAANEYQALTISGGVNWEL